MIRDRFPTGGERSKNKEGGLEDEPCAELESRHQNEVMTTDRKTN